MVVGITVGALIFVTLGWCSYFDFDSIECPCKVFAFCYYSLTDGLLLTVAAEAGADGISRVMKGPYHTIF